MNYSWWKTAVEEREPQRVYICGTHVQPRHQSHATHPKRLVRLAIKMQNGAKHHPVFLVVATRLSIKIWALWLATLATSLQVAFGGVAQPGQDCERWNLPIAGVAVQINRVQYFSLSALVREGSPICVICT